MVPSSTLSCFSNIFEPYYLFMVLSYSIPNILTMISTRQTCINLTYHAAKLETKTPTSFSWSELPDDLLGMIFGKVWTGDRVRVRLVCKSWNRILIQSHIPTALEAPWEILSNDSYNNPETYLTELRLKSLSENRIYRFKLPMLNGQPDNRGWLCAHSRGWLVMAVGPNLNPDIFLWNPLSGATRKLPLLSTLPFFEDFEVYDDLGTKVQNFSSVIDRIEIFSVGNVDCVVAALFRTSRGKRIALCSPHELKWTPLIVEQEEDINFVDILFHTIEGNLKALVLDTNITAKEFESKKFVVTLMDCQVQVVPLFVTQDNVIDPMDDQLPYGFLMARPRVVWRLVESSITRHVLYVNTTIERFVSRNRGEGLIPKLKCEKTLDMGVSDLAWKKEAIFLGATGSFALPIVHGIVPDCIYFAIDEANGIVGDGDDREPFIVRESGQYFLTRERKCMRRNPSRTIKYPSVSKIGWFMPQLFMY